MHIDKILRKATKAKKNPHWCIDHQKWETEKHDTVEPWNNQVQKADADEEIPWGGEEHKPTGMYTDRNVPTAPIPPTKLVQPGDKYNLQDEAKTAHQDASLARLAESVKERFGQEAADKVLPPDKGQQMAADSVARNRFLDYVKVGEGGLENPRPGARALRNSIENSLLKLMKANEEDEEEALREAGIRGLPSAKNPNRGQQTRAAQAARDIHRTPKSLPMTAGPTLGEGDKPEFVRDEFGNIRPSRATRNRALRTSHTDTSTDVEEPYSAGRTYEPTDQPAEGRKGKILSQHVRREDRPVTAGERAEGAGIDTSVPFPRAMTQPNPEDMAALLAQEGIADKGGGENKGMKQPRKPIEESLLKLMKEGAPEEEETLTDWMPPGTPRDPRERPMNELQVSNRQLANLERTEGVKFPRHPKGHPKAGQWTGANPIPNRPPEEQDMHPGSIAPPNMEEAFQKFQKMWVRKSTPRPFSVTDNLLFLIKADTTSEPTIGPEDVGNMGLHKGPAEMKHVLDVPGVGRCHVSNVIKGPGQAGHPQGRTMLVLTLPNGERQPFYKRTGTGTRPRDKGNEGPSDGGSWVPIDGIDTGGKHSPGWFDKARTTGFRDTNDPLMRYGNEMYKQVGASLDSLNEAGKIATADDLVAAGHAKVPGVADPNEEGPWSRLEINNWLGNDTALGHNDFAHQYRDSEGSSNWEHHNKQRQERGDSGAPHNALPGREGEAPADKPYREPSPRDLAAQEEANPLHESAHHQWKADTHDHLTEHMAKPHHERDAEFNQYAKEMWNGQRHTWQDHEKHFHHAMSGFGRFVPKKGFSDNKRAAALYDLPPSKDGLFSFSEIFSNIRERNRNSTGTAWEPSDYSEKKHGRTGTKERDRGWFKDRNDYQFSKYPKIMQGIEYKDPVYKRGRGSGQSLSPLTGDVVKQDKLMEEYMTHPQGGAGGHAFGKGMWGPRPDFSHPQHGEERDAADAQRNLNQQQQQGEAMRQMIPPEAPLRGGQYPGMQNALLKLMKGEGKQLPLPGMESPEPKNPAGEPGHLEPSKRTNKEQVSDIWAKIRDEVKRRRGLEKDTESEDTSNKAEDDKWEERESPEIDVPGRLGAHYKEMYGTAKLRAGQAIPGNDWDCPWCDKQINTRAHNLFTHGGRKPIGGWMGDEEITPEQFDALSQPSPAARERAEMVLNNQRLDAKGLGHMKTPIKPDDPKGLSYGEPKQKAIMNSLLKLMKASKVANMPAGPTASTMQSGIGGKPAKTSGEWKATRGHGLGGAGFATPPQDGDNIHADLVPIMLDENEKNVEKSLLSLMKYGSVKPSAVGMTRKNAINLDKEGPAPAAPRRSAEEEEMMGGSGPGGDPTGMGAEVASMIGSIAGMAAGGKRSQWSYREGLDADDKAPPGTPQGAEGATAAATTGTEAAGTPQTNPQQGQGLPPAGNEAADTNADMGSRMTFDKPTQPQTPQPPNPAGTQKKPPSPFGD